MIEHLIVEQMKSKDANLNQFSRVLLIIPTICDFGVNSYISIHVEVAI